MALASVQRLLPTPTGVPVERALFNSRIFAGSTLIGNSSVWQQ